MSLKLSSKERKDPFIIGTFQHAPLKTSPGRLYPTNNFAPATLSIIPQPKDPNIVFIHHSPKYKKDIVFSVNEKYYVLKTNNGYPITTESININDNVWLLNIEYPKDKATKLWNELQTIGFHHVK